MAKYAENTAVPSAQSRAEIERTLERFGAYAFAYSSEPGRATIAFDIESLRVIFRLPLPDRKAPEFQLTAQHRERSASAAADLYEKAVRQRWRALALAIKAKFAAIDAGITTVEDEFLAHIALPQGGTVGEHVKPKIREAYASEHLPALLPGVGRG